jgi:glycosyltransferase involved in cell wall biosynthesis
VSIVTPSFNSGAFIEATIQSVEQQDYPWIEHIVLDSGSTDGTLDILARHPAVRLITPAPQGVSAKMNLGFSKARGDIICWLNADDYHLPGAVTKAVEALKSNPEAGMVYCNLLQVDEHGVEIHRERTKQASLRDMLHHNYVPLESAFVRREALERVGPVNMRYPLVQDWEWFIRITELCPILWVDDWWSVNRVQSGQRSQLYISDVWTQVRKMTKEHGAPFLPVFWSYWGAKFVRAGVMLGTGQFPRFAAKLRMHIASYRRRSETRKRVEY